MKKKLIVFMIILLLFPLFVNAKESVKVYIFEQAGCQFCKQAKEYLTELKADYNEYFEVVNIEITKSSENGRLMVDVLEKVGEKNNGVPLIVIGEKHFTGFADSLKTNIKNTITEQYESDSNVDIVDEIIKEKDYDINKEDSLNTGMVVILVVIIVTVGAFFMFKKK